MNGFEAIREFLQELTKAYPPPEGKSHSLSLRNGTLLLTLELPSGQYQALTNGSPESFLHALQNDLVLQTLTS